VPRYLDFPYHLDGRGRTAETDVDDHVRDLVRQVLLTAPGERLNRPDFGCGLGELVFAPASDALAAATQLLVQGALSRWLADAITVVRVAVAAREERLEVTVEYVNRRTGERRADTFGPGART
jgi:phage baseplate assembly protein W